MAVRVVHGPRGHRLALRLRGMHAGAGWRAQTPDAGTSPARVVVISFLGVRSGDEIELALLRCMALAWNHVFELGNPAVQPDSAPGDG